MSDYASGYWEGQRVANTPNSLQVMQQRRAQQEINDTFQNQANQYQNLLNRFNNLVADYNNLNERFNLRGERLDSKDRQITHSKNATNILEKGFQYQSAAHTMIMNLPYLATTTDDTGGFTDELRKNIADLRNLPGGEQEYQDLIAHVQKMGRSIADETVLAPYLDNEIKLMQVSTQMRDPKGCILEYANLRQFLRARVNNPMPVSWPDRREKLLELMDAAMQVTEATQERRFMNQFYHILVNRLLGAIFGHMAQGKDCAEPEPVAAALEEALRSDVFPFFPEKRRVHFGSTLREIMIDKDGNSLGSYGDWLRNNFATVLGGMDELYLLRRGNLSALQSLIPQAASLDLQSADPQTSDASGKKGANGNWWDVPVRLTPVQNRNGNESGPVWGDTGIAQEQGNPWAQSTPPPKPAEPAKKAQEPHAGVQPSRNTWGGGPS
jgi:hypothetical protein